MRRGSATRTERSSVSITEEQQKALRAPFDKVGKLPRVTCKECQKKSCQTHHRAKCDECGQYISTAHIHIDYIGHAEATDRLLSVDPEWNWEPLAFDDEGLPHFTRDGDNNPVGLWIKLTVCGVTRLGVGTCNSSQTDPEKVLIGDALRNAAMRFGVALDLWVKDVGGERGEDSEPRTERPRGRRMCVVCEKPLTGPAVAGGGGFAHPECVEPPDPSTDPF